MPMDVKQGGIPRVWEYSVGLGLLATAVVALWSKISDVEKKSDECAKTNVSILINQIDKSTEAIDRSNEINQEVREALFQFRQMPKYKRL